MKNLKFLILIFFIKINFCYSMENFNPEEITYKNTILENLRSNGKIYTTKLLNDLFEYSENNSNIPNEIKIICQKFNLTCNRIAVHWYCVNGCTSGILGQRQNLTERLTDRNKYLLSIAPFFIYKPQEETYDSSFLDLLIEELHLSQEEQRIIATIIHTFKYFQTLCCFNNYKIFSFQDFEKNLYQEAVKFGIQVDNQLMIMISVMAIAEYMAIYFEPDYNPEMPSLESPLFGNFEPIPTKEYLASDDDEEEKSDLLNFYGTDLYMQGGFLYWFRYISSLKNADMKPKFRTMDEFIILQALERLSISH